MLHEVEPVLLWYAKDKVNTVSLKDKDYFFIGRLKDEDIKSLADTLTTLKNKNIKVKIFLFKPAEWSIDTGFESIFVSRRHLKIVVNGDQITIINHGKNGLGPTNPTYINGVNMGTERFEKKYSICETVTSLIIKPSSKGPIFIIACSKNREIVLPIDSGTYLSLPRSLAEELVRQGIVRPVSRGTEELIISTPIRSATTVLEGKDSRITVFIRKERGTVDIKQMKFRSYLHMIENVVRKIEEELKYSSRPRPTLGVGMTEYGVDTIESVGRQLRDLLLQPEANTLKRLNPRLYNDLDRLSIFVIKNVDPSFIRPLVASILGELEILLRKSYI